MLFILQDNCVKICYARMENFYVEIHNFIKVLSKQELEKASKLTFPKDGKDFIVCRGLLRHLLGRYLNIPPSKVRIQYGSYGKPQLAADIPEHIYFNLSHSRGLVAFVICLNEISGIDLEYVRPMKGMLGIVEDFFSDQERHKLSKLPDREKVEAFFRIWTRKEACLKAIGMGLSYPLSQVEISTNHNDTPCEVILTEYENHLSCTLIVTSLNPGPGYTGALALGKENKSLKGGSNGPALVEEAWLTTDLLK